MMMEVQEEVMGCKDHTQIIIKGKRTKRQKLLSPLTMLTMGSSSSSGGESGGEGARISDNSLRLDRVAAPSPTTSIEFTRSSTEEEEDMANCLILLAQGNQTRKLSSNNVAATSKVPGLYVYQCKTCNRCFPSFQALGGHRASHKKPKACNGEKKVLTFVEENDHDQFNHMSTTLSLQLANRALCSTNNHKRSKVHECSICGAEFSSGQALGGHMRRHRAFTSTTTTTTTTTMSLGTTSSPKSQESKKPKNILQLDLNLPAPEDDHRESKFSFASKEQVIVFSASSLVDCHY